MAEQGLPSDLAQKLLDWYDVQRRVLPWRALPGEHPDPYRVWLSEIMLQQTTVVVVKDYFLKFTSRWPSVKDLAAAPIEDILQAWAGLGYYARARNLHKCAQLVAHQYNGVFPAVYTTLLTLPGVGPYTAGAIAAIAFDLPHAAVDGNVDRVISRLYNIETPLQVAKPEIRKLAQALVPQQRAGDFAQAMMDLGATICAPRKANCAVCPWHQHCRGALRDRPEDLPFKKPKTKVPTRYGTIFWIEDATGAILVRTRKSSGLLGGMTEFPSSDWSEENTGAAPLFQSTWHAVAGEVTHTFTHFHLVLQIQRTVVDHLPVSDGRFVRPEKLHDEALPSVMRKVARHMGL